MDVRSPLDERTGRGTDAAEGPTDASEIRRERRTDVEAGSPEESSHDALTGVLCGEAVIGQMTAGTRPSVGSILTLDLDGFRSVNEGFGYPAGDDVLRQVAQRIVGAVGPGDVVGRFCADDFVVVTARAGVSEVERLAERLVLEVQAPVHVAGQPLCLRAHVGIASIDPRVPPRDSFRASETAMYRAKGDVRRHVVWYDATVAAGVAEKLCLIADLRNALARDEFVLHYQPAYDLRSGQVVGAEALIRWEHPQRGRIAPGDFIPAAESSGLIGPIGDWALGRAAAQARVWPGDRATTGPRPPTVWVNASLAQLTTEGFARSTLERVDDAGVDPSRLGIEITESVLAAEIDVVVAELRCLRDVGVQIALDDFGTGYSSLARLSALPIDVLKLDQGFVRDLPSRTGRAMVAAIIDLAHAMDVEVIAEGVETADELKGLRRAGCDMAAGFLLARPVPPEGLEAVGREGTGVLLSGRSTPSRDQPPQRSRWYRRVWPFAGGSDVQHGDLVSLDNDPVTGLGNSRVLRSTLQDHLEAGRRPVLLLVELDGYRALTAMRDTAAVDVLLRAQAERLRRQDGATPFRLDEDVFALVIADGRRGPAASQVDLTSLTQGPKGMTACVGVAQAEPESRVADLEDRARAALSLAKRRGHGSVVDREPVPSSAASTRVTPGQARALYAALRAGYLRVHYQPIVSLTDDTVLGYEALVRPQLDHGLSGPDEAFEVAAHLGLVPDLDAVRRASIFADGPGFDMPAGTQLFVKIAPEALGHRSLRSAQLRRQIEAAGLDPRRVVFELRGGPIHDPRIFAEESQRLRQRGFRIALEDVGGVGGDLGSLRAAPFEFIKLAPDLLADARGNVAAAATLEAVCAFAEHAAVPIIATGIETPRLLATAASLRRPGDGKARIQAAQGYHLGKPQPQARSV